jgi:hypothetical protein
VPEVHGRAAKSSGRDQLSSSPESRITSRGTDEPENHDIKDGGDAFVALDSATVLSALRMLLQGKWVS